VVDGVEAHAEDRWVGREARVGEALLRFNGHVGRCLITSRDPDTGKVDWHPSVIAAARETGLSVDDEGRLIVADAAQ